MFSPLSPSRSGVLAPWVGWLVDAAYLSFASAYPLAAFAAALAAAALALAYMCAPV